MLVPNLARVELSNFEGAVSYNGLVEDTSTEKQLSPYPTLVPTFKDRSNHIYYRFSMHGIGEFEQLSNLSCMHGR